VGSVITVAVLHSELLQVFRQS